MIISLHFTSHRCESMGKIEKLRNDVVRNNNESDYGALL